MQPVYSVNFIALAPPEACLENSVKITALFICESDGTAMRWLLLALTFLFLLAGSAGASIISAFDTSDDGWTSADVCAFNSAAGNPPGDYDCGVQVTGPTLTAPAAFLGNDAAAYGNTFSFDIFTHLSNLFLTIDLAGDGKVLTDAIGNVPASNSWQNESVLLTEAGGWIDTGTSSAPSQSEFQNVLADVTSIKIAVSIPTFTDVAFDNIALNGVTAVPEPSGLFLMAPAAFILIIHRKRRLHAKS
jgi:hypothetical protein